MGCFFRKLKETGVIGLVLAFGNKETKVSYKARDNQTEWYNDNIGSFRMHLLIFRNVVKFLNLRQVLIQWQMELDAKKEMENM